MPHSLIPSQQIVASVPQALDVLTVLVVNLVVVGLGSRVVTLVMTPVVVDEVLVVFVTVGSLVEDSLVVVGLGSMVVTLVVTLVVVEVDEEGQGGALGFDEGSQTL